MDIIGRLREGVRLKQAGVVREVLLKIQGDERMRVDLEREAGAA